MVFHLESVVHVNSNAVYLFCMVSRVELRVNRDPLTEQKGKSLFDTLIIKVYLIIIKYDFIHDYNLI